MRLVLACAALCLLLIGAPTQAATTFHQSAFIDQPAYFNGFEKIRRASFDTGNPAPGFPAFTAHAEGGIAVTYIGQPFSGLSTTFPIEGERGWYAAGGPGYTSIKRTDESEFHSLQFLAKGGYLYQDASVFFQALYKGTLVETGRLGVLQSIYSGGSVSTLGLSGLTMDELRLQASLNSVFDRSSSDVLMLDSIGIGGNAVREPATWAMLLVGFGAIGFSLRRSRNMAAIPYSS